MTNYELQEQLRRYPPEFKVKVYDPGLGQWLDPDLVIGLEDEGIPDAVGVGLRKW